MASPHRPPAAEEEEEEGRVEKAALEGFDSLTLGGCFARLCHFSYWFWAVFGGLVPCGATVVGAVEGGHPFSHLHLCQGPIWVTEAFALCACCGCRSPWGGRVLEGRPHG